MYNNALNKLTSKKKIKNPNYPFKVLKTNPKLVIMPKTNQKIEPNQIRLKT